ncbi:MAG: DnaJ domain-containing protein [Bdellovibrionota bacterium]
MPYTNLALYTAYSSTDIEKEKEQRHGLSRERRELIAITEASQALIACIAKKITNLPNDTFLENLDLHQNFIGSTQSIVTGETLDLKLLCNKIIGEYGINTLDARILANFRSRQITKEGEERTFRDFSIAIGAINMLFAAKITNVAFTKLLQKALKNPTLRTSFTTIATKTGKAAPWLGFGGQLLGVSVLFHIFSTALTDITTIGYDLVTNGSYDEKNPYKKDFTEAFFHRYFNTEGIMHGFVVMGLLGGLHKINHAILQSKRVANISSTLSKVSTSGGKDAYKLYLLSKKHSTTINKVASGAVLGTFFAALPAAEKQIQELLGNSLTEVPLYKDEREKVMSIASAFASGFIFAGLNHFLNGTSGSRAIQSMGQANMSSMSYRKALETLGIDLRKTPNPTMAQIKKAYKSANQKLHPDKNREATQKELDAILEKFHAVKEAYNRVK